MAVLEPWRSVGMPRGSQGEGMNVSTLRSKEMHFNHIRGLTITSLRPQDNACSIHYSTLPATLV